MGRRNAGLKHPKRKRSGLQKPRCVGKGAQNNYSEAEADSMWQREVTAEGRFRVINTAGRKRDPNAKRQLQPTSPTEPETMQQTAGETSPIDYFNRN